MADDFQYVRNWLTPGVTPRAAFQGAIDYMYGNWGGGKVFAPPGNFTFDGPVIQKGGTIIEGAGRNGGTFITSGGADLPLWQFDASASRACLRDVFFASRMQQDATQNVMSIADNVQVFIRDCDIWGGSSALFNMGTDCRIRDCFISGGAFACLTTNGANFYDFCKFDSYDDAKAPQWSVYIGTPTQTLQNAHAMENFFNFCDMSGAWRSGSLFIDDSQSAVGPIAFVNVQGGVISGAVVNNRSKQTMFGGGTRFGSQSFINNGGSVSVSGCAAMNGLTLPSGVLRGSGNINIGGGTFG